MKLSNVCLKVTIAAFAAFALAACPSPDPGPDQPDAGAMPRCGDGICQSNESKSTCAQDCGSTCGDGTCEAGETASSCPADCHSCGDGTCQSNESAATCPADCQPAAVCGDNVCASTETTSSCPLDCDARLKVNNDSSYTIYYLYIAQCGASSWGSDQLGAHVIGPSTSFTITNIPPGCWAFKATDSTAAHTWTSPTGVNLTVAETYTWSLFN